jgi:hypothetical protein
MGVKRDLRAVAKRGDVFMNNDRIANAGKVIAKE